MVTDTSHSPCCTGISERGLTWQEKPSQQRTPRQAQGALPNVPYLPDAKGSPRRQVAVAAATAAAAVARVRIRMYRLGVGDCFLLAFPRDGQEDFRILDRLWRPPGAGKGQRAPQTGGRRSSPRHQGQDRYRCRHARAPGPPVGLPRACREVHGQAGRRDLGGVDGERERHRWRKTCAAPKTRP